MTTDASPPNDGWQPFMRRYAIRIRGKEHVVSVSWSDSPLETIRDYVSQQGFLLTEEDAVLWLLEARGWRRLRGSLRDLLKGRVCYAAANCRNYYILREFAGLIPKERCEVCKCLINSRVLRPKPQIDKRCTLNGFVFREDPCVVCSTDCAINLFWQNHRVLQQRKLECANLKKVKQQMIAIKAYLNNRNPEVFQSLPEGFRPAESSPS